MLSPEDRLIATQFNLRSRQLFWRGLLPENSPAWQLNGDDLNDWVINFQAKHDLVQDGCLGPSSLLTIAALNRGGIGGCIIDGKEIEIPGVRVARMFSPADSDAVSPDVCCILSMSIISRAARDRLAGTAQMRAHFSIDSSIGLNNHSLVIQWADPARRVPFCPAHDTSDYPKNRQAIGVELDNFLLMYEIDADERQWRKRRKTTKATIHKKVVAQPMLYESQVNALAKLLDTLCQNLQIPHQFPMADGIYNTDMLDGHVLDAFKGCLARFHYFQMNNEPGAGFASNLETLFGKLAVSAKDSEKSDAASNKIIPMFDASQFDEQRQELAQTPQPTSTFAISHETEAPFNLANAVAAAYRAGKGARAARIADKCKKFDE